MNVIKKILLSLFIVLSIAGCKADLTSEESIKFMNEAEQNAVQQQTPSFAPYLSKEDVAMQIYGNFIPLDYAMPVLKFFGYALENYNAPTISFYKLIMWAYAVAFFIFVVAMIWKFIMAFWKSSLDQQLEAEGTHFADKMMGLITPILYFFGGGLIGSLFALVLWPSAFAVSNAAFANAMNEANNNTKLPISNLSRRINQRNDIAEAVFARKLEEKRTSMAKAVRFSRHMVGSSSSLDGNDRDITFSDFAAYQSKLVGIEYATNINRTVDWVDIVFSWGVVSSLSKFFNAEKYTTVISLFGKSNGGFFIDDILNFDTSSFTIGLGKDVIETNDDFASNDSNSLKRRNTIAAGMNYKGKMDAITALNSIQGIVKASLAADDYSYVSNTYDSVYNAVKADYIAAAKSVEDDIKTFETDAQRVEITSSVFGLVAAAKYGINRDEDFIKIYNWLDQAGIDWLSVNCADTRFNYNVYKKSLATLNASSKPFYAMLSEWGSLDPACIYPVGNQYQLLTMDQVNDVAAIKAKYINSKSHTQALKIYYNIVTLAGKDAYREVIGNFTNSNNRMLKKQLKGVAAAPTQLIELVKAKHEQDVITNRIDNAVTYNYVGGAKQNNNFVDDLAVFGSPENKNYVKEADQVQIRNMFRPIAFASLWDDNTLATGNIASLNQFEKTAENSFAQGLIDAFTDTVLGHVDDAMKYAGALPMSMNITDGLAYCDRTGCVETFKPSLFETVVISGKKFRDAGVQCIATIAAVKAANDVLDISDTANAAGSSGGIASAKGAAKGGGKLIKTVSAGVAGVADVASTPCFIMLAAGITNGDIMPMSYSISLVFLVFTLFATTLALFLIYPFVVVADLCIDGQKMEYTKRVIKHGLGLFIVVFIMTAGTLFTFAALLMQPYQIVRLLLDIGFGTEAGLIAGLMSGLSLALVLPLLFKFATNISDEIVKTLLQIMNMGVNVDGAKRMNDQMAQTAIGGATAAKIQQASRVAEMPIKDFNAYKKEQEEIMKQIKARENLEAASNARHQASNRGQFEDEGKKRDDDHMKDPDFKKATDDKKPESKNEQKDSNKDKDE